MVESAFAGFTIVRFGAGAVWRVAFLADGRTADSDAQAVTWIAARVANAMQYASQASCGQSPSRRTAE